MPSLWLCAESLFRLNIGQLRGELEAASFPPTTHLISAYNPRSTPSTNPTPS